MRIQILKNAGEVSRAAACFIVNRISKNPRLVLGLATGSTPQGTYAELVRMHRQGDVSFADVVTFNLDEYLGLSGDHPQSYRHFMNGTLFSGIDIKPANTHVPNGTARDPNAECEAYEQRIIAAGGVDLWLLGIGQNGHVAFNEPGSAAGSRTRVVDLSESTIAANSDGRFFSRPEDVPRRALTAGMGTVADARALLMLATGEKKAEALRRAIDGTPSPDCPASLLQGHRDFTVICDELAASLLGDAARGGK
ncbi:glucosamine-6-phosphate deaminase [Candidatus Sumerlaeota bacterium]|nr:glucosamine-6-phosphate deaminase [Candidatus Sumerlaeota bacterium]